VHIHQGDIILVDLVVVAGEDHHLHLLTLRQIIPLLRENLLLGKLVHTQQEQLVELLVLIREKAQGCFDRNKCRKHYCLAGIKTENKAEQRFSK